MYVYNRIAFPVIITEATVNAGFRCPSLSPNAALTATPANTAMAQPAVIEIHPAFSAFDRFSNAPATTPLPSTISTNVPRNSPTTADQSTIDLTHPRRDSPVQLRKNPQAPEPSTPHHAQVPSPSNPRPQAQLQSPLEHPETAPASAAPARPQPSDREAGDEAASQAKDHRATTSESATDRCHKHAHAPRPQQSSPTIRAASTPTSAKPPWAALQLVQRDSPRLHPCVDMSSTCPL